MATNFVKQSGGLLLCTGLGSGESTDPIPVNAKGALSVAIQAVSGGGSGFNGGTCAVEVSLDGTTFVGLGDLQGNEAVLSAAASYVEVSVGARAVFRVTASAAVSDVDVYVSVGQLGY